jgi:hypothetical protein
MYVTAEAKSLKLVPVALAEGSMVYEPESCVAFVMLHVRQSRRHRKASLETFCNGILIVVFIR